MSDTPPQDYIHALLDLYLQLPDTPAYFSDLDHQQAQEWHQQQVPLQILQLALLLAAYRRASRSPQARPLPPIRSLRYFRPVVEELQANPPSPQVAAYLRYKAEKLLHLTPSTSLTLKPTS
jgi:hypothetical protein